MSYTYAKRNKSDRSAPAERTDSAREASRAAAYPGALSSAHRVDLPDDMRAKMENAFGTDLSAVKLYESRAVADAGAQAVARGSDIAFAPGRLDLSSRSGQTLLGHELSHVVSQARGEVSGSGFLYDAALESRAEREGAMAAAGQQVYSGGVTGALSTASPVAAAGPMQARKDGEEGEDYRGTKTANPAQRSQEQLAKDQALVENFGDELEQDTGWDMNSQIEKRGFFSRNVGKYFYKNDSAKNVLKNIGVGAGLVPMLLAKGAWTGLKKIGTAIRDSDQEAVDQFNNYDEDYKKMGKWGRFKSFLTSPIAWMTASRRKAGTRERNERRAKILEAAKSWRETNAGRFDNADVNFDALEEIPKEAQRGDSGGRAQKDLSALGTAALVYTGGNFGTTGIRMAAGVDSTSAAGQGFGSVGSAFSSGSAMLNMANSIQTARNQSAIGDDTGAASAGLEAAAYGGSMLGSMADTVSKTAGAAGAAFANNPILTGVAPALNILTGLANASAGAVETGRASAVRSNMTDTIAAMDKRGPLSRDQQRLRNTFEQAHEIAKGDQAEGITESIGGTLQATGGAATLSGLGALPGTIIGGIGTGIKVLGGKIANYMRKSAGEAQLDKDVDFTKQVEIVKRRFAKMHLSDKEAEDLVLQSMGMFSGDKKEAVQRMTMKRAFKLTSAANDETDVNHAIAAHGAEGMALNRVNGKFSLQGVAHRLGFDKNKSWQEQMRDTRRKGAYYNPFSKRLA